MSSKMQFCFVFKFVLLFIAVVIFNMFLHRVICWCDLHFRTTLLPPVGCKIPQKHSLHPSESSLLEESPSATGFPQRITCHISTEEIFLQHGVTASFNSLTNSSYWSLRSSWDIFVFVMYWAISSFFKLVPVLLQLQHKKLEQILQQIPR